MNKFALFTDVSLNPKLRLGFGAYVIVSELRLGIDQNDFIESEVKLKKFQSTSSTKLEIETLLWALEDIGKNYKEFDLCDNLTVYTDSRNIVGLQDRRERLERFGFKSMGKNKELRNAALYRRFYSLRDAYKFELIKLKGHSRVFTKDTLHKMFSLVDKESRKALKTYLKENN
ncbi:MAG: hypothetical protein MRJ65_14125 [Candidatus Brocadiaceae bacterium]|nr:hypothetical protein [Candidatus Brocadiaceae bacterium]